MVEALGQGYVNVKIYYNKKTEEIGLWFWKSNTKGAYSMRPSGTGTSMHIGCKGFYRTNGILEKIDTSKYFPATANEDNPEFWIVSLNKPIKD
jgi:hypothetical protein